MVGVCLLLQLVVYLLMYRIMRVGGRVFRPDEDDKMDAYRRIHGLGSTPDREMREMPSPPNNVPRSKHYSQVTDNWELLLPEPAIGLEAAPPHTRLSPQMRPGHSASPSSSRGNLSRGESSYGTSPEWQGQDQPLLGLPPLPPRRAL